MTLGCLCICSDNNIIPGTLLELALFLVIHDIPGKYRIIELIPDHHAVSMMLFYITATDSSYLI